MIIAFLSFALGAPPPQQDRYLARRPISAFSWAWPATAGPSNYRLTSASATADSVRSQIWGHGSGIPSLPTGRVEGHGRWWLVPCERRARRKPRPADRSDRGAGEGRWATRFPMDGDGTIWVSAADRLCRLLGVEMALTKGGSQPPTGIRATSTCATSSNAMCGPVSPGYQHRREPSTR